MNFIKKRWKWISGTILILITFIILSIPFITINIFRGGSGKGVQNVSSDLVEATFESRALKNSQEIVKSPPLSFVNPKEIVTFDEMMNKVNDERLCDNVCNQTNIDPYRLKVEKFSYIKEFYQTNGEDAFSDPHFLIMLLNLKSIRTFFSDDALEFLNLINSESAETHFIEVERFFWTTVIKRDALIDESKRIEHKTKIYKQIVDECKNGNIIPKDQCIQKLKN